MKYINEDGVIDIFENDHNYQLGVKDCDGFTLDVLTAGLFMIFFVQTRRFRFTIAPFCCVFPAYLHYTPSKTACEVLLLFSTPYVEKLITTTKENDSLVAAL